MRRGLINFPPRSKERDLRLQDVTTNDVSITRHGLAPKAPNDATKYLDGTGVYSNPPGTGGAATAAYSYLGYNTIGGSNEVMTNVRTYLKKITVPSNGIITSISAHVKGDGGNNVHTLVAGIYADSGGNPSTQLGGSNGHTAVLEMSLGTPVYRWFHIPCGVEVVAGDYWVGFMDFSAGPATIAYDGSGSDQYYTSNGSWTWDAGGSSFGALTVGSRKYSIRATFLPTA